MKNIATKLQPIALIATVALTASSFANDYADLKKDMRIMKKIIETSIDSGNFTRSRIDATYLAKQGIVFKMYSSSFRVPAFSGDWEAWGESVGAQTLSIVSDAIPAVAPVLPPEALRAMEAEVELAMAEVNASGENRKAQIEELKQLRELKEKSRQERELYRDSLRELREVEREKMRAEKQRLEELNEKQSVIEKSIKKYKETVKRYEQKALEYKEKRTQEVRKEQNAVVNTTIAVLCDYQASLKALPNDEHVTLVFEGFGEDRNEDKVMVFEKSDLDDCDSDDSGVKNLIAGATVYNI